MNTTEMMKIQRFLVKVRETIDPDMSVQRLSVLLEVAMAGEIDQASVVQRAKLRRSATSKNVAALTSLTADKRKGPGLIESTPDPMNLRSRILKLTPKGRTLLGSILPGEGK